MPLLNDWIDGKFKDIAAKLPNLVHTEPASFACGYNTGYKSALLDLEKQLERICEVVKMPKSFQEVFQTNEQIVESMQW